MFVSSNFASSYVRQLRHSNPIEIMWNPEGSCKYHTTPCAYTDEYSMDFETLSAHQALTCRHQLKPFHANLTTNEFGKVMVDLKCRKRYIVQLLRPAERIIRTVQKWSQTKGM